MKRHCKNTKRYIFFHKFVNKDFIFSPGRIALKTKYSELIFYGPFSYLHEVHILLVTEGTTNFLHIKNKVLQYVFNILWGFKIL